MNKLLSIQFSNQFYYHEISQSCKNFIIRFFPNKNYSGQVLSFQYFLVLLVFKSNERSEDSYIDLADFFFCFF